MCRNSIRDAGDLVDPATIPGKVEGDLVGNKMSA
jgi:hypothetical protein